MRKTAHSMYNANRTGSWRADRGLRNRCRLLAVAFNASTEYRQARGTNCPCVSACAISTRELTVIPGWDVWFAEPSYKLSAAGTSDVAAMCWRCEPAQLCCDGASFDEDGFRNSVLCHSSGSLCCRESLDANRDSPYWQIISSGEGVRRLTDRLRPRTRSHFPVGGRQ